MPARDFWSATSDNDAVRWVTAVAEGGARACRRLACNDGAANGVVSQGTTEELPALLQGRNSTASGPYTTHGWR